VSDEHTKHTNADATVLMTGAHADRLADAIRGANISITRLETVQRDLIRSNNAVIESNRELVDELRKGRRQGKKDRRER
jgi:hypothetical protein